MSIRPLLPLLAVLGIGYTAAAITPEDHRVEAARTFLASLSEKQSEKARFSFTDTERLAWNFLPNIYRGVPVGDLSEAQGQHLGALLGQHLSPRGLAKFSGVRRLEEILFERESRPDRPAAHRDPDRYWIAFFGTPGEGPWGWRVQGHHLSLNFTFDAHGSAHAPLFLGANPRVTEDLELLGAEERLARCLLQSLDAKQRDTVVGAGDLPRDVLLVPGRNHAPQAAGLLAADMNAEQVELMSALRLHLASYLVRGLRGGGEQTGLRFFWLGSTEPGKPHYWRIQSDQEVIEWCTPQGDPGHVHLVWRDLARDLGGALSGSEPR